MIQSLRSSKNLTCAYYDPDNPIGDGSSNSPHYWDNICSFERTTAAVAGLSSESYGRVYVKVFLKQGVTYKIGVTDGREYNKNQDTAIWLSADDGSYKIERVDQDGFAWMYGILCTEGDNVTPKQDGIWTISPGNMSGSNSITRTICIDPPPGRILGENAGPSNDSNKVSLIRN